MHMVTRRAIEKVRDAALNAIGSREDRNLARGRKASEPAASPSSLLLDALDPDDAEAGVFAADVRYIMLLFFFERLERVHISEL